jgi:hypothetical protein
VICSNAIPGVIAEAFRQLEASVLAREQIVHSYSQRCFNTAPGKLSPNGLNFTSTPFVDNHIFKIQRPSARCLMAIESGDVMTAILAYHLLSDQNAGEEILNTPPRPEGQSLRAGSFLMMFEE